jgi:hypothetical protein
LAYADAATGGIVLGCMGTDSLSITNLIANASATGATTATKKNYTRQQLADYIKLTRPLWAAAHPLGFIVHVNTEDGWTTSQWETAHDELQAVASLLGVSFNGVGAVLSHYQTSLTTAADKACHAAVMDVDRDTFGAISLAKAMEFGDPVTLTAGTIAAMDTYGLDAINFGGITGDATLQGVSLDGVHLRSDDAGLAGAALGQLTNDLIEASETPGMSTVLNYLQNIGTVAIALRREGATYLDDSGFERDAAFPVLPTFLDLPTPNQDAGAKMIDVAAGANEYARYVEADLVTGYPFSVVLPLTNDNIVSNNNAFSISNDAANNQYILIQAATSTGNLSLKVVNAAQSITATSTYSVSGGDLHIITLVAAAQDNWKLYAGDALIASSTTTITAFAANSFAVGTLFRLAGSGGPWNGSLGPAYMVEAAMTAPQVAAVARLLTTATSDSALAPAIGSVVDGVVSSILA